MRSGRSLCATALALAMVLMSPAQAEPARLHLARYEYLGPFTAADPERLAKVDIRGTDLGVSFPYRGADGREELIFLFGDTHVRSGPPLSGRWDEDSIARAPIKRKPGDPVPALDWLTRADGSFLSLLVPGAELRGMEVPLDGIQIGEGQDAHVLLFFNDGWEEGKGHSILHCAEARGGDFGNLARRFSRETSRFLNVSVSRDNVDPSVVWIFGTGKYRRSPIYLAKAPVASLDDLSTWSFRAGDEWVSDETKAEPILDGKLGELSARFVPAAKCWVLMYQRARGERRSQGVYLRTAATPTGPWSDEVALLEPDAETGVGFGEFMHRSPARTGFDDGLSQNIDLVRMSGDPYGPYLVPEWCYEEGGEIHLIHTLSSWNPYATQLMDAVLTTKPSKGAPPASQPVVQASLEAAWSSAGEGFKRSPDGSGWALEDAKGLLNARWTVSDGQKWLYFDLAGPSGVARLIDARGVVVRESVVTDPDQPLRVRWRIDRYRGKAMTLAIEAEASEARLTLSDPKTAANP